MNLWKPHKLKASWHVPSGKVYYEEVKPRNFLIMCLYIQVHYKNVEQIKSLCSIKNVLQHITTISLTVIVFAESKWLSSKPRTTSTQIPLWNLRQSVIKVVQFHGVQQLWIMVPQTVFENEHLWMWDTFKRTDVSWYDCGHCGIPHFGISLFDDIEIKKLRAVEHHPRCHMSLSPRVLIQTPLGNPNTYHHHQKKQTNNTKNYEETNDKVEQFTNTTRQTGQTSNQTLRT